MVGAVRRADRVIGTGLPAGWPGAPGARLCVERRADLAQEGAGHRGVRQALREERFDLDAGRHNHGMDELSELHLGHTPIPIKELIGKINAGQPCVIFPEGRLSVTGALMKIYAGPAYIADRTGATIVPVRPRPHCTSSSMSSTSTELRNGANGFRNS